MVLSGSQPTRVITHAAIMCSFYHLIRMGPPSQEDDNDPLNVVKYDRSSKKIRAARVEIQKQLATVDFSLGQMLRGEIGDGKIFVLDVAQALRIRTGEAGNEAL